MQLIVINQRTQHKLSSLWKANLVSRTIVTLYNMGMFVWINNLFTTYIAQSLIMIIPYV